MVISAPDKQQVAIILSVMSDGTLNSYLISNENTKLAQAQLLVTSLFQPKNAPLQKSLAVAPLDASDSKSQMEAALKKNFKMSHIPTKMFFYINFPDKYQPLSNRSDVTLTIGR